MFAMWFSEGTLCSWKIHVSVIKRLWWRTSCCILAACNRENAVHCFSSLAQFWVHAEHLEKLGKCALDLMTPCYMSSLISHQSHVLGDVMYCTTVCTNHKAIEILAPTFSRDLQNGEGCFKCAQWWQWWLLLSLNLGHMWCGWENYT